MKQCDGAAVAGRINSDIAGRHIRVAQGEECVLVLGMGQQVAQLVMARAAHS